MCAVWQLKDQAPHGHYSESSFSHPISGRKQRKVARFLSCCRKSGIVFRFCIFLYYVLKFRFVNIMVAIGYLNECQQLSFGLSFRLFNGLIICGDVWYRAGEYAFCIYCSWSKWAHVDITVLAKNCFFSFSHAQILTSRRSNKAKVLVAGVGADLLREKYY